MKATSENIVDALLSHEGDGLGIAIAVPNPSPALAATVRAHIAREHGIECRCVARRATREKEAD